MLEGLPLGAFSQWGIVGVVVMMILFGVLIPVRTHNREIAELAKSRDDWRAAAEKQDARGDVQAVQIAEMLELARTSHAIIQSLQVAAQRSRQDRGRT